MATESLTDGMIVIDRSGIVRASNAAARDLMRIDQPTFALREWTSRRVLLRPDRSSVVPYAKLPAVKALRGVTAHSTYWLRTPSGGHFLSISSWPMFDSDGAMAGSASFLRKLRRPCDALVDSGLAQVVIDRVKECVFWLSPTASVLYCNETARGLLGLTSAELTNKKLHEILDDMGNSWEEHLSQIERHGATTFHSHLNGYSGKTPVLVRLVQSVLHEERAICAFVQPTTESQPEHYELLEESVRRSLYDPLTDLASRSLFFDRLERLLARQRRTESYQFALVCVDIDRFQVINDSLGFETADALLVEVARRLRRCANPRDTVARLGGDEFAVLLHEIHDVSEATRFAERALHSVHAPVSLGSQEMVVTASAGIALSTDGHDRPEEVLRDATTAVHRAKKDGSGGYQIFDRAMHDRAIRRVQLESELRVAVEQQQFECWYQPIISLATGRITSLEALVRWRHPERGLVFPQDFIELAEEIGLVNTIDELILREAARQVAEWRRTIPHITDLSVGVNVSGKHICSARFQERLKETLASLDADPSSIKLEITETVLLENIELAADALTQISKLGINLLLDDFGTGYSSLSYLHRLPIDVLKIDRSFINLLDSDHEAEIVKTIITLAHTLKLGVVAEGIETAAQLEALRALDCELGQGYYFSKPLPAEELETMLQEEPRW